MFQRIRHSFAARLNFYILSFLILLFSVGFGLFYHYATLFIEKKAQEKINILTEKTNLKVTHLLRSIEKIPEGLSWIIPTYVTTPDSIFSITRQVVGNNYEVFGCSIAFEPYYFPEKGKYFAPYSYMKGDSVITTEISGEYDYYRKNWYRISKNLNASRWSRPYHELSAHEIITTTYSVPLHNQHKKVIGIFSVDLSLNWLINLLESTKPFPDSYHIIVNREGHYILHTPNKYHYDPESTLFDVAKTWGDPTALNTARLMLSGESGRTISHHNGTRYYIFYAPLKGTDWYMATLCPYSHIYEGLHHFYTVIFAIFFVTLALIWMIISILVGKITRPLKMLATATQYIAQGDFTAPLPVIKTRDETKALYQAFADMQQKLSDYVSNLERATQAKEKIESELRIAHDIQMSMLPKAYPSFPDQTDVELYAALFPARQVGGDFYDYFTRDRYLYFAIGDVSGKGVPASLLMASTISLLRSLSSALHSPASITNTLNDSIAEQDNDLFITFFIGRLDMKNGELKYCNAGHTPPVLTHPDGKVSLLDIQPDLPMGILKGHEYKEYSHQFLNGSGILLYTDGVTDAENQAKEFYGSARLLQLIRQNHTLHPREFINKILGDIYRHTTTQEPSDDLSMITLIYGPRWKIKKS